MMARMASSSLRMSSISANQLTHARDDRRLDRQRPFDGYAAHLRSLSDRLRVRLREVAARDHAVPVIQSSECSDEADDVGHAVNAGRKLTHLA
jgi:hypothetical protein